MRPGGINRKKSVDAQMPQAATTVLPLVPKEPVSETGSPLHQKPVGHTASLGISRI